MYKTKQLYQITMRETHDIISLVEAESESAALEIYRNAAYDTDVILLSSNLQNIKHLGEA